MQIDNYINALLFRYECVIIPGFGAFLTQSLSARLDDKTQTFYPPSKIISFNKQLQTNDGLLAQYVASVEKISYETALQNIRAFAAKVSFELREGQTVHFKNIGDFQINEEKAIQFEPSSKQNFNTSAFGLGSFKTQIITREIYAEQVRKLEEKAPILFSTEQREARPYLKYAAIALIALMATGFGGLKFYENQIQAHNLAQKQKATVMVESQIQQATFVIENPLPALNLNLPKHSGNYHLVAGAFQLEDNANKKMVQLQEKGYSPKKMAESKYGLYQVLYSSFEDRAEALKSLREIQRAENPDAWLLIQELPN